MGTQAFKVYQRACYAACRDSVSRRLEWGDLHFAFGVAAQVTTKLDGDAKLTRNRSSQAVRPTQGKNCSGVGERMQAGDILHRYDELSAAVTAAAGIHLLVAIDHRLARIYRIEFRQSVPQQIIPYDAAGYGRHLHHSQNDSQGKRKSDSHRFFSAIARTMERAEQLLLFGSGIGAHSVMDQLLAQLELCDNAARPRVIWCLGVDERQVTEDQLLAKAREIYATNAAR